MSWFGGIVIQTNNSVPGNFEVVTVNNTPSCFSSDKIKPTSGTFNGVSAQAALLSLEGGDIRFRIDGLSSPTNTLGHLMVSGDTFLLLGSRSVNEFRAIRAGNTDGILTATYFF